MAGLIERIEERIDIVEGDFSSFSVEQEGCLTQGLVGLLEARGARLGLAFLDRHHCKDASKNQCYGRDGKK